MANIERGIKAVLAKRGLEFSLKDETSHSHCKMVKMFWSFYQQFMGLLWQISCCYFMLLGITNSIVVVIYSYLH